MLHFVYVSDFCKGHPAMECERIHQPHSQKAHLTHMIHWWWVNSITFILEGKPFENKTKNDVELLL